MKHRRIFSSEICNLPHFFSILLQTALRLEINLERRWKAELRGEKTRKEVFVNNNHVPIVYIFSFSSLFSVNIHFPASLVIDSKLQWCLLHSGEKMRQIGGFAAENSAVFHNSHLTIQVFLDRSRPGTELQPSGANCFAYVAGWRADRHEQAARKEL